MAGKTDVAKRPSDEFDVVAALKLAGIEVSEILDAGQEVGDGWVIGDKEDFINVPFIIVDYRFATSDKYKRDGEPLGFVVLKIITREFQDTAGETGKYVLTDGSVGIYKQMGEWVTKKGVDLNAEKVPALVCRQGLTVSRYVYKDEDKGTETDAATFYIPG